MADLSNEATLWLKYQENPSCTPLYIAACYAPPEGSTTYSHPSAIDPFEELGAAIATVKGWGGEVLIGGDFNSRTGSATDFPFSSARDPFIDLPQEDFHWQAPTNLPARTNQDSRINKFGRQLLQLCCDSGVVILNGRVEGDLQGCCTCQGSSTVD